MKFQINKASDLNSISVLPPHSRRQSTAGAGVESSNLGKNQQPQLRSQQSQQSFSQGSQHGLFSQLSQNSMDDVITNDQRTCSQERESSARKASCLPPLVSQREDSQLPMVRPNNTNLMRKWSAPEKCQISEELEHRIGMMETSLSRSGMILDSMQSDIMQTNKGTKELALEIDSLRQRIMVHENSLQTMSKGLEDIKSCFERGLKALSNQFKQNTFQESSREISSKISALPEKFETCILKLQNDLIKSFTREMQVVACNLKVNKKSATPLVHPSKVINHDVVLHDMQPLISMPLPSRGHDTTSVQKIKMGCWKTVKHELVTSKDKFFNLKKSNQERVLPSRVMQDLEKANVESDEDMDGGFFSLFKEKGKGVYSMEDTQQETEQILRKARKRKRKHCNPIILD